MVLLQLLGWDLDLPKARGILHPLDAGLGGLASEMADLLGQGVVSSVRPLELDRVEGVLHALNG